jgi:hypothetical protein
MLKDFLIQKYGKHVTEKLMNSKNEVIVENRNDEGDEEQQKIVEHLRSLLNENGEQIVPEKFLHNNKKGWALDFSSWIGQFNSNKEYMIIGAEPHVWRNYQLVYNFGNFSGKTTAESAQLHFAGESTQEKIFSYLPSIFVDDTSNQNKITQFLEKCYLTDLCHIVPKGCGQVKDIIQALSITAKAWEKFRRAIAEVFLKKEIAEVCPKYIILHGDSSREFFEKVFKVKYESEYKIEDSSKYKILTGKYFNNGKEIPVISIPHLAGQVRNELWLCKKWPKRPISAKTILNNLIK